MSTIWKNNRLWLCHHRLNRVTLLKSSPVFITSRYCSYFSYSRLSIQNYFWRFNASTSTNLSPSASAWRFSTTTSTTPTITSSGGKAAGAKDNRADRINKDINTVDIHLIAKGQQIAIQQEKFRVLQKDRPKSHTLSIKNILHRENKKCTGCEKFFSSRMNLIAHVLGVKRCQSQLDNRIGTLAHLRIEKKQFLQKKRLQKQKDASVAYYGY